MYLPLTGCDGAKAICNPALRLTGVAPQDAGCTGAGCKRRRTVAFQKSAPGLQRISPGPPQYCSAQKRRYGDEKGEELDAVEHDGDGHAVLDVGHDLGEVLDQVELVEEAAA